MRAGALCATLRGVDDSMPLHTVIDALLLSAAGGRRDDALVQRIEDALARGYVEALRLDARRRRMDVRIAAAGGASAPFVQELTAERQATERCAAALRGRLATLRECFVSLGGTRLHAA